MKTTQNVLVVVFCSLLFVAGYVAGVTRTKGVYLPRRDAAYDVGHDDGYLAACNDRKEAERRTKIEAFDDGLQFGWKRAKLAQARWDEEDAEAREQEVPLAGDAADEPTDGQEMDAEAAAAIYRRAIDNYPLPSGQAMEDQRARSLVRAASAAAK
jgi:hypothetical protein